MRILRFLCLGQYWIYFVDGSNRSVYWWPRGKTIANCITCALIHACLPSRGFLASHLDLQCLPKCQVHLPAQGQVFPYDMLGNRTWVEMNARPEQNSSKACLVSTSSLILPLYRDTGHVPKGDASSAGTRKAKTGGAETQSTHSLHVSWKQTTLLLKASEIREWLRTRQSWLLKPITLR